MDQVLTHLSDIERKLGKIDKISSKGASSLNMKDMVKLSRKGSSVTACMKKTIKELNVPDVSPTSLIRIPPHTNGLCGDREQL